MTRRFAWAAVAVLLALGTCLYVIGEDAWHRPIRDPGADAAYYYAYVPSLVFDRDLDFTNEYAVTRNHYKLARTATGRPGNVFGIGPALFELPTFAVGHAIARLCGEDADGFSRWETGCALWAGVPFTLGAVLVAIRLARRRIGLGVGTTIGPVLALLAGPVIYYAIRQPGYAHPFATFFAALLVERWDASYDGARPRALRTWLVLGATFGALVLARPQTAPWGLVLVAAAADDVRRRGTARPIVIAARWLAAATVAALLVAPQLIAWRILYGAWYLVPQGAGFMRWDAIAWSEVLFSSRNGLFPWAPLYAVMFVGLVWLRPRSRLLLACLLGLAAQTAINGAVWDWWAGGAFGGRRFDSTYIVFALGAAALAERIARALRDGVRRVASRRQRVRGAIALVLALACALTSWAQLSLVATTSVVTVRTHGGMPAWEAYERTGGLAGMVAAQLSVATNALARAHFAWTHDVGWYDYDRLVGVHYLGETFPGLNSYGDKLVDHLDFRALRYPRAQGLVPMRERDRRRMVLPRARLFVGLNRRGPVAIRLRIAGRGPLRVAWNDRAVAEQELVGYAVIDVIVAPERGVNWLVLEAPTGTVVWEPELRAR